jgi:hypothetical protein
MSNPYRWYTPLDPDCPNNPMRAYYDDPMSQYAPSECADLVERRHLINCPRCQEYGATNIEVVGP